MRGACTRGCYARSPTTVRGNLIGIYEPPSGKMCKVMTERTVTAVFADSDIVFTVSDANGVDEGEEFICSLGRTDQARFRRYLERLRDGYQIKSPENMRHIKGLDDSFSKGAQVHELKSHSGGGLRLYLVRFKGRWYVTHGARKGSDRMVIKQAKKALSIFWDGE